MHRSVSVAAPSPLWVNEHDHEWYERRDSDGMSTRLALSLHAAVIRSRRRWLLCVVNIIATAHVSVEDECVAMIFITVWCVVVAVSHRVATDGRHVRADPFRPVLVLPTSAAHSHRDHTGRADP